MKKQRTFRYDVLVSLISWSMLGLLLVVQTSCLSSQKEMSPMQPGVMPLVDDGSCQRFLGTVVSRITYQCVGADEACPAPGAGPAQLAMESAMLSCKETCQRKTCPLSPGEATCKEKTGELALRSDVRSEGSQLGCQRPEAPRACLIVGAGSCSCNCLVSG